MERRMHTIDTRTMDLMDGWFDNDSTVRFRANFALHRANGADDSAAVVIELEPGNALGQHTDSPEELLLVMEGTVEIQVGNERQHAHPGTVAVVPAMVPHTIRNVGEATARVIGFFPRPCVVATFAEPVQPLGEATLVFGAATAKAAAD
jgi:quercetin dioxygenase-like cupin family protein